MDNWMEDRLNGGYGQIIDQLQAAAWDNDEWLEDYQEIEIIPEENN